MNHVFSVVTQTPLWIWPLFAMLLWVGYRRTSPRVSRTRILFFLPVIVLALSIKTMAGFPLDKVSFGDWAGGLVLGLFAGWLLTRNQPVRADYENNLIELPGTWTTMSIVMLIFFSRYYFGYKFSAHPELKLEPAYIYARLSIMGLFGGLFIGRMLGHLIQYRRATPEDLSGERRGFIYSRLISSASLEMLQCRFNCLPWLRTRRNGLGEPKVLHCEPIGVDSGKRKRVPARHTD